MPERTRNGADDAAFPAPEQGVEKLPVFPQPAAMTLRLSPAVLLALGAFAALTGCDKNLATLPAPPPDASGTNVAPPPFAPPTNAQPKLPVMKLQVGNQIVAAELARKPVQLATGMMFRKEMAEDEGMLFAYPFPQQASFYMRNTTVPLTIAYLDPAGRILELHDLKPLDETPVYSRAGNILFVLEMKQGWFSRHGVLPGVTVVSEQGPLKDTVKFEP